MNKKINLEEILYANAGYVGDEHTVYKIKLAMLSACSQTLELAAENAETEKEILPDCGVLKSVGVVNKQSILNTINQIE